MSQTERAKSSRGPHYGHTYLIPEKDYGNLEVNVIVKMGYNTYNIYIKEIYNISSSTLLQNGLSTGEQLVACSFLFIFLSLNESRLQRSSESATCGP